MLPKPRRVRPIGLSIAFVAMLLWTVTTTQGAPGAGASGSRDSGPTNRVASAAKLADAGFTELRMFAAGGATGLQARAAQAGVPVSTGSCELVTPQTFLIIDRDRAKKRQPALTYHGFAGARCSRAVVGVSCYAEIWRRRDFKVIGHLLSFGKDRRCTVSPVPVPPVYYRVRNKHWTKAAVVMKAPVGAFWGSGQGPAGWACHGQGTRDLSCVRSSAVKE